jgi:hypothetical protein
LVRRGKRQFVHQCDGSSGAIELIVTSLNIDTII